MPLGAPTTRRAPTTTSPSRATSTSRRRRPGRRPTTRPARRPQLRDPVPELEEPHRGVGDPRPETDPVHPTLPAVRAAVQPADRGHGQPARRRADHLGPQEARRDPHRPRQRDLPAQLHRRAVRVQRHRPRRGRRLPDLEGRRALQPGLRRPDLHRRQRPLRPRPRLRQWRLRPVPGVDEKGCAQPSTPTSYASLRRPRRLRQARRSRSATPTVLRQHAGLLGHRGQLDLRARQQVPRQRDGPAHRLVRRATRACRRSATLGAQRDLLQQQQRLLPGAPGLLQRNTPFPRASARSSARSSRRRSAPAS